ncbi:hypothetical protein [Antarctobacter sp.]|uniref:hypothetical protein n=1 Tax=Antarctobacter sp. TaxID=1872577 RepID=UPI002B27B1C1|nr:hypothetical protein [Antarctobacter sp.]
MTHLLVIDIDPTTGEVFPVMPDEHRSDTDGYNTPPVPMTRAQRCRFKTLNKKYRKTMPPELAWYHAVAEAMEVRG